MIYLWKMVISYSYIKLPEGIQERINFCPSTSRKPAANFGAGAQAAGADRLQDLLRVTEEGENGRAWDSFSEVFPKMLETW